MTNVKIKKNKPMSEETKTESTPTKKSNKKLYIICLIIAAIATVLWNKTDIKCSLGFDCPKDSVVVTLTPTAADSAAVKQDTTKTSTVVDSIK